MFIKNEKEKHTLNSQYTSVYFEITTRCTGMRFKNKEIYYTVASTLLMFAMTIQMLQVYLKLLTVIYIIVYPPLFI